ncbi:hypothetical protein SG34_032550 [Thalassomonas viridans]|uniref:Uncharacterized protein n=1 Tax=Thalassomonas viridans TaxID=137584 RepID=A0AAE9Z9L6_9GAMM|nr:hypothetical protein [Thalassomonas viridans]WDE08649.1 hypothetical protein SG34_032550 [Thalassomonas viridans]
MLIGNSSGVQQPGLKVVNALELKEALATPWLLKESDRGASVKIIRNSRYYLHGVIRFLDNHAARSDKAVPVSLAFKLVAARRYGKGDWIITHFVINIAPKNMRKNYALPFLIATLRWLSARGYAAVRFPVFSRRRCQNFTEMLLHTGFQFKVLNRYLFQTIKVELQPLNSIHDT